MLRNDDIVSLIAADIALHRKLEMVVNDEYELLMSDRLDAFRHLFVKQCRIERDIAQLDTMIVRWAKTSRSNRESVPESENSKLLAQLRERKEQLLADVETIGTKLSDAKKDTVAALQTLHSGQRAVRSYGVSAGNR